MKAIVIKPGRRACLRDLDLSYHNLRTLVGGYIEMTYPFPDEEIAVISNEEAKLLDLAPNRAIRSSEGEVIDIYCGTMVVVALAPEGEYRSLTEEEVNAFCTRLPRYKRPRAIIFADIPRNPTGKIEKPKLREIYCAGGLVATQINN